MPRRVPPRLLAPALLTAAVLAAFWPALGNDFVNFDDPKYVTENQPVQHGFDAASLRWAWTTDHLATWHPVTWMSHMLDWQLFGPAPAGHHATSVLLHTVNTLLLFLLLERTTGAVWRSALVAALFGVHPLRVESVAWVAERKDVLSTLFWFLTMLAYVGWVRRRGTGRYLLVVLGLGLGLAAKPMVVTLPLTLLLLDYWPLGRWHTGADRRTAAWRLVREKLPLVPLVAAASAATLLAGRSGGAVGSLAEYPLAVRVGNAIVSYVAYLGMMLWPRNLAVLYPYPETLPLWKVAACAALLLVITATAIRARSGRPYLLVGWLWFLGTLVPVIGLVQVGGQALADRYTYVPLVGIFVAAAWLVPTAALRLAPAAVVLLAALVVQTRVQVGHWRDSVALFTRAIAVEERNPDAHVNLAFGLLARGETERATAHFERALAMWPAHLPARIELGNILLGRGRLEEAVAHFRAAVATHPASGQAHNNLGYALLTQGRLDEAMPSFEHALRLDPGLAVAHNHLGVALARKGRNAEARAHFERAVHEDPHLVEALNNLANMLIADGHGEEALRHIARATALRPDFGQAHASRAAGLLLVGRYAEAWAAVRLARTHGTEPPEPLIRLLRERMPEPAP